MKKRYNHPQKTSHCAAKDAPMESMAGKGKHAKPSYADMLQETVALPPPDGYPRPVIFPPPDVDTSAKRGASRSTESRADYDIEPQLSLSEPERDKN